MNVLDNHKHLQCMLVVRWSLDVDPEDYDAESKELYNQLGVEEE